MNLTSEQIQALKALYANVEKQAHALRGNPREYSVITGLCPVNVIEMQAQKIQALLAESEADKALIAEQAKRIAELEAEQTTEVGQQILIEAIGAHGYIVGCLNQGRPDLALAESLKWVEAFSVAAHEVGGE
ncbi:hypothetical protein [Leclercia adecarboxylata]|uniref:hypothetical protein n=1 Tax=Leclercia adecarboxylata TaxID=83655 RepID=UPI00254E591A|nr:hypothetical protein [Leclercia adecarboxylata]